MTITSYESFDNDIRADFKAGIAVPHSVPVQWENAPFQPDQNTRWVAVDVLTGDEELVTVGPPHIYRFAGVLFCRVHTALEKGVKAGKALGDLIADRYRGTSRAGVTFRGASVLNGVRKDDWFVTNVQVRFFGDLQKN